MKRKIRKLAFVKRRKEIVNAGPEYNPYKFTRNEAFIYFGEIPNMPGHGIFLCHRTEKFYVGLHIDEFEEMSEEEV